MTQEEVEELVLKLNKIEVRETLSVCGCYECLTECW